MYLEYEYNIICERLSNNDLHPVLSQKPSKHNMLLRSLQGYWRWITEGPKKDPPYYDNYHDHIDFNHSADEYNFSIQTFDSPEGDTWWVGRFKLIGGKIEIIEETTRNG